MMRIVVLTTLGSVLAGGAVCAAQATPEPLRVPFGEVPGLELKFELDNQQPDWTLTTSSDTTARYTWQDYLLELAFRKSGDQSIISFKLTRQDGRPVVVQSYAATVHVPLEGLHAVMVPATRPIGKQLEYYHANGKWQENVPLHRCLIPESFQEKAIVNNEAPFILLTDNTGSNRFSAGWAAAETASVLTGEKEGDNYVLMLARADDQPFRGKSVEDALIINTARLPWMRVETAYARQFDEYNNLKHEPVPDWAYEPVFCTWYCYSENIDQDLVLKIARKCKELGFGTILIDAGWDKKQGQFWGDLDNGGIGDYAASDELFPDLPGLVKQMQDMGLRVQLWAAPFWQARGSKTYQEKTKTWMTRSGDKDDYDLCPKYPETRELLKDQFAWIAKTYGIDGMWLDVCDGVAHECKSDHKHLDQPMGKAWVDCMAAVRDGLRSVRPDAVTEARILHANLNSKRALDVIQCGDTPKNFDLIRLALIHLRAWAYDIVVKNDPMIWPTDSDAATVGKYLATMVTSGVPALSVDFLTAPEEQCLMTAAWLAFYKEHKTTLIKGSFDLCGPDPAMPDMMLTGADEAVIYIRNSKTRAVMLPKTVKRIYVLNCTESDEMDLQITPAAGSWQATTCKPDWSRADVAEISASAGSLQVPRIVPQGGAAVMEAR